MPSKSKRKGKASTRKPLVATNTDLESPESKIVTIDDYFPPSPPLDNNNYARLEITTETVFYNGPSPEEAREAKSHLYCPSGLPTPEDSPEKEERVVKSESHDVIDVLHPSLSEQNSEPEERKLSSTPSTSNTSNASEDSFSPVNVPTKSKSKSKRRGRPTKVKTEEPRQNHLLTDFFPVRKSSRKTAKELQREQDEIIRNQILDECEDGLKIVNYEGKGRGIESAKTFSKGEFIVEYAGDLVEIKEAKCREETYQKDTSYGCYMYFFNHKGKSYCIDATQESGKVGRLLNHSRSKPNCITKTIDIGDHPHLILVAGRDIELGEELVYDYGDRSKEAIDNNPWLKE